MILECQYLTANRYPSRELVKTFDTEFGRVGLQVDSVLPPRPGSCSYSDLPMYSFKLCRYTS
jgi:hypothetical protein